MARQSDLLGSWWPQTEGMFLLQVQIRDQNTQRLRQVVLKSWEDDLLFVEGEGSEEIEGSGEN